MSTGGEIERLLRYRILGRLHAGQLRPGDRLPSIRQLVQETGADHRAIARAYRALAEEGLVEIRPGSGIYVSLVESGRVQNESASWVAGVLLEGWHRQIGRARVGDLVGRCASARIRCACIESNEDHMVAVSGELEDDFSLDVLRVMVSADTRSGGIDPQRLCNADLVVSTVFHADAARAAAARAGRPFVLLSLDPGFASEIDRRLREGSVTAVAVDLGFAVRGEAYFAVTGYRGRIRYVLAHQVESEGVDLSDPTVLVTRAARRQLGMEEYHLLPPPMRVISAESARELFRAIVGAGLEQPGAASGGDAEQEAPASRS